MYIETKRLVIRNFQIDDVFDLFEVLGDCDVMRNIEEPFSLEETKDYIIRYGMSKDPNIFAIEETGKRKVIGQLIFHSVDNDEIFEIGFVIGKRYWRNGYAYETANAILHHAFIKMSLHKIICETRDKIKAIPLLNKLGMTQEALMRKHCKSEEEWQDLYWFALLRDDYMKT